MGWWAGALWVSITQALSLTIVGMPLGTKIINKTPKVVSLSVSIVGVSLAIWMFNRLPVVISLYRY